MVENMKADFARDLKDMNINIGEVSSATGTLKKKQLAIEEETQLLRNSQADAIVQTSDLKQELGELQTSCSTRRPKECRCGSSSLLRKLNSKLDRDIGKSDKVLMDFGRRWWFLAFLALFFSVFHLLILQVQICNFTSLFFGKAGNFRRLF